MDWLADKSQLLQTNCGMPCVMANVLRTKVDVQCDKRSTVDVPWKTRHSSGDEIANVNFFHDDIYAVRPGSYRIR